MRVLLLICFALLAGGAAAQTLTGTFLVNPTSDSAWISPYIYGTNGQPGSGGVNEDRSCNIAARRIGGNRLTGYNWETNASNMGSDYTATFDNDNYLPWSMGIPDALASSPGKVLTAFHDTSVAMGAYSILTLQAAGYVAGDKAGPVGPAEVAPSPRFKETRFRKGGAFGLVPDPSDGVVYDDEAVNFLVQKYGPAVGTNGVKGYQVDNEPALWPLTHQRIHPGKTTCAEIVARTVALARAVKAVDPTAEIFGGVSYGFNEQYTLQDAPDWSSAGAGFPSFNEYFLQRLADSSAAAGFRLMDVYDFHWYPDLDTGIVNDNVDDATVRNRVQAPRSLWDATYTEAGWIGKWFKSAAYPLVPVLKSAVARRNPGTKLSVTEFDYGGKNHPSGAVATADVLGLFGKYGIYLATHWGGLEGYLSAAYKLYRNYDGKNAAFGDIHVQALATDYVNGSVYAAVHPEDHALLDVVVINKNMSRSMQAQVVIAGSRPYTSLEIYAVTPAAAGVQKLAGGVAVVSNTTTVTMPPLSVYHLVFRGPATSAVDAPGVSRTMVLEQNYPNPFNPRTTIRFRIAEPEMVRISIFDLLGREVATLVNDIRTPGDYVVNWDGGGMATGAYYCRLQSAGGVVTRTMLLMK